MNTATNTSQYIYICVCVCVCVCARLFVNLLGFSFLTVIHELY